MTPVARIFDRYEEIRHRTPAASSPARTHDVGSLLDMADRVDAFVFDAFGVLNIGDTPIPGAADRLDQLRAMGKQIRILSNAASYDHASAVDKFRKLGMRVGADEIITSRDATLRALDHRLWGCIAAPGDDLDDIPAPTLRLDDHPATYDRAEGILFLSSEVWTDTRQAVLTQSLTARARPVMIANADLVAPREGGLTREPGFYGHLLADAGRGDIRFFGKPFAEVFAMIEQTLDDVAPARIAMVGDTLHTDILGGAARGWGTVLVTRDGLFAGEDTARYCQISGIHPTWRAPRI